VEGSSTRCMQCGEREVWDAPIASPPRWNADTGVVSNTPIRLCRECWHDAQRAEAADWRRFTGERLARLGPDELGRIAEQLAEAARIAPPKQWREMLGGLRFAEQLRGSPWPPEIRRYLLDEADDDREPSA
jgi:hypothetical protein